MFAYFPTNYVWNLSVNIALGMGAQIGEVDQACRAALEASKRGDDEGTVVFCEAWATLAKRVAKLAEEDESRGRLLSASAKYRRAAIYYATCERMYAHGDPRRDDIYTRMLDSFAKFITFGGRACERVEIPYEGTTLPALFVRAPDATAASPGSCMIHFDGLDVMKEIIYLTGIADALTTRGVSLLIVDHPGVGEAVRRRHLTMEPKTEKPAAAALDLLAGKPEIDSSRIGIIALSLGGYYAPRAAAFEPRLACCVAWGANYDWGEMQRVRYENQNASKPVPHYWEHVKWVTGQNTAEDVVEFARQVNLRGVLDRIRVPILITHGENDRQIPLKYAHMTFDDCINSPKRELKIHTKEEVAAEHCSADNTPLAVDYMADWIAETLGGHTRAA